jgi:hypothetical protein
VKNIVINNISFCREPKVVRNQSFYFTHGATKRCRLSWLTNSAHVYEPKFGGDGEFQGLSQEVQLYTEAQINFGDVTPYLTYDFTVSSRCTNYRRGELNGLRRHLIFDH